MKKVKEYLKQLSDKINYRDRIKRMGLLSEKVCVSENLCNPYTERLNEIINKMREQASQQEKIIMEKYKLNPKIGEHYLFLFSIKFNEDLINDIGSIGWKLVSVVKCSKKIKGKYVKGYKYVFTDK